MTNLLLCGLNSYLGRAGLANMPGNGYKVFGIVRDVNLLKGKMDGDVNASLFSIDLIKKGKAFEDFHIEDLDLSVYFAQIPNQKDKLGVQYELVSLRNFICLSKRNGCNRIIYVGRTYDKSYLDAVESLFIEVGVNYTILLKDLAVGPGSSFEGLMNEVLQNKSIYICHRLARIKFKPIILSDLFAFIKKVDWQSTFINQRIEFGGERLMSVNELIHWNIKKFGKHIKYNVFSLPSRTLSIWLNKILYGIEVEVYNDYLLGIMGAQETDNSVWREQVDFTVSPIE
ncbi:hypothetical protein [Sphingobacterium faecale]|uniref:Uncharacterized protein n=1 Tax=Sphingobacterium faecale TaxID=2803775 RepID=A0ABS1R242_9SPHI|nr:hypothetical protein [Sphingobacterium faecale]MBL1408614.1 hypothetical protein [Sphingobacterium faecale]